jgi:hypothetical protein
VNLSVIFGCDGGHCERFSLLIWACLYACSCLGRCREQRHWPVSTASKPITENTVAVLFLQASGARKPASVE